MKIFKFSAMILLLILVFGSCKKDTSLEPKRANHGSNMSKLNDWSPAESDFFSIKSRKEVEDRSTKPDLMLNAFILEVRSQISEDNEKGNFVGEIIEKVGKPNWGASFVYSNRETGERIALIPFLKDGIEETQGILLAQRNAGDSRIIINAKSRRVILESSTKGGASLLRDKKLVTWMRFFDKAIFKKEDQQLVNAFDVLDAKIKVEGEEKLLELALDYEVAVDCNWRAVEICDGTFGPGVLTGPGINLQGVEIRDIFDPHGDHDHDGIENMDDQDWTDWEYEIYEWWNSRYPDQDYGDWWDGDHDNDGIPDRSDPEFQDWLEGFAESFYEGLNDFWDGVGDLWDGFVDHVGDFGHWVGGLFGNHHTATPCYSCGDDWDDDYDGAGPPAECTWYFVLDCGGAPGANWWDQFEEVEECPSCNEYSDWRDAFIKVWQDNKLPGSYENAGLDFVDWVRDCNPQSPEYESCALNAFESYLSTYYYPSFLQRYGLSEYVDVHDLLYLDDEAHGYDLDEFISRVIVGDFVRTYNVNLDENVIRFLEDNLDVLSYMYSLDDQELDGFISPLNNAPKHCVKCLSRIVVGNLFGNSSIVSDNTLNATNTLEFNSYLDVVSFVKDLDAPQFSEENVAPEELNVHVTLAPYVAILNIDIYSKLEKQGEPYSLQSVSSNIVDYSLPKLFHWQQSAGEPVHWKDPNVINNYEHVQCKGILNVGIIYNDNGMSIPFPRKYVTILDRKTGEGIDVYVKKD